jgi:hypothetical protein
LILVLMMIYRQGGLIPARRRNRVKAQPSGSAADETGSMAKPEAEHGTA